MSTNRCRILFFFLGISSIVLMFTSCKNQDSVIDPNTEDWVSIFNGQDLDGWTIKISGHPLDENFQNTFRVADSMLSVDYSDYAEWGSNFGHIFYKTPYSYYKIKLDHRFNGVHLSDAPIWADRNSGIMVHSQSAESMTFDQDFPKSLEMQLLVNMGEQLRHTGNLCTPGTMVHMDGVLRSDHCIDSNSEHFDTSQWISAEVEVYGDSLVRHLINGKVVLEYQNPVQGELERDAVIAYTPERAKDTLPDANPIYAPLDHGYIALQAESQNIDFKNIMFLNLEGCMDEKALNFKSYYVKDNPAACVYK